MCNCCKPLAFFFISSIAISGGATEKESQSFRRKKKFHIKTFILSLSFMILFVNYKLQICITLVATHCLGTFVHEVHIDIK